MSGCWFAHQLAEAACHCVFCLPPPCFPTGPSHSICERMVNIRYGIFWLGLTRELVSHFSFRIKDFLVFYNWVSPRIPKTVFSFHCDFRDFLYLNKPLCVIMLKPHYGTSKLDLMTFNVERTYKYFFLCREDPWESFIMPTTKNPE